MGAVAGAKWPLEPAAGRLTLRQSRQKPSCLCCFERLPGMSKKEATIDAVWKVLKKVHPLAPESRRCFVEAALLEVYDDHKDRNLQPGTLVVAVLRAYAT